MGRHRYPIPYERIHITIPAEDKQRIEVILFSEIEQKVPRAAWQKFISARIREFLDSDTLDLTLYGFPLGHYVRGQRGVIRDLKLKMDELLKEVQDVQP